MQCTGSVLFLTASAAAVRIPCRNQAAHGCHADDPARQAAEYKTDHNVHRPFAAILCRFLIFMHIRYENVTFQEKCGL